MCSFNCYIHNFCLMVFWPICCETLMSRFVLWLWCFLKWSVKTRFESWFTISTSMVLSHFSGWSVGLGSPRLFEGIDFVFCPGGLDHLSMHSFWCFPGAWALFCKRERTEIHNTWCGHKRFVASSASTLAI